MPDPIVTPENMEEVRAQLAALQAQQNRDAVIAENEARAARRALIQPVADILDAPTLDIAALRAASAGLPIEEESLAGLCRSLWTCGTQAKSVAARRITETEPLPVPEITPPAQPPET